MTTVFKILNVQSFEVNFSFNSLQPWMSWYILIVNINVSLKLLELWKLDYLATLYFTDLEAFIARPVWKHFELLNHT